MRRIALCLSLLLAASAALPAQTLTLEGIFGRPGLIKPLPRAFEFDAEGGRLLYLQPKGEETWLISMDLKTKASRPLLNADKLKELSGKEKAKLSGFHILPKGRLLLTLDSGTWLYASGAMSQLLDETAEGVMPSSDGRSVAFAKDFNVFVLDLETRGKTPVTVDGKEDSFFGTVDWVYDEELDLSRALFWSSDGNKLAYLQFDETQVAGFPITNLEPVPPEVTWQKYPKAGAVNPILTLWLFDRVTGESKALLKTGPGEYLARADFSPDSGALFVQTLNRPQTTLTLARLDLKTGSRTVVLKEEDPAWVNVHDNLVFLKTRPAFLWTSERTGWSHLYQVSMDGKTVKPLTWGDFEVTQVLGTDKDEKNVFFMSTEKTRFEKHLYRLSLKDGKRTLSTYGPGSHSVVVSPDGKYYVDTASNLLTPTQVWLHEMGKEKAEQIGDSATQELKAVPMPRVDYFEIEGCDAVLLKPADFDPLKKYPVLVEVYGGPGAQMTANAWGRSTFLFHTLLTQQGYLVFRLDNRGSAGKGHAWEAELLKRFGQKELEDQLNGVAWLKEQAYVDPARIGIWGWSYGGYMTLYALTHSKEFKAGVAVAPVTDWHYYDSIYTERYLKLPKDNEQGYQDSSPIHFVKDLNGKLLLVHGSGDDNVHFQNSFAFIDKMIEEGKPHRFLLYPNRDHSIRDPKARIHLFSAIYEFILENL